MPWKGIGVTLAVMVVFLIALGRATDVVVDWAWFASVGYVSVFWTSFIARVVLFAAAFAVSALLLWVNGSLALRFSRPRQLLLPAAPNTGFAALAGSLGTPAELLGISLLPWRLLILATALAIALLVAFGETSKWDLALQFIYQVPYRQDDPLFGNDIGFYLFSLPVYVALKNWMVLILLLCAAIAGAVYVLHGEINLDSRRWRFSPAAIAHGSALLGGYFAVRAWSYALDRYLLLYNDNGIVVGAGYTDVHVQLPILWLLIGLAAAAAVVALANVRLRSYRPVIAAAALVFGGAFLFGELLQLAPALLSANAQTWVNLHLLFTHGNGVVMSPVTQKSTEGLPNFYLKDIPPIAAGGPAITEPRIYFGQGTGSYVIARSSTPEFDYPKGKDNVYANYDGADGIAIGGAAWRSLFAWQFDDVNILLSSYITSESRIMLHRNIQDRVATLAPFLHSSPYFCPTVFCPNFARVPASFSQQFPP